MAENRNLHVTLNVDANTRQAKTEFQELLGILQQIQTTPSLTFDNTALTQASAAAQELQQHLQSAVNVDTGKLNLNTFAASLNSSGKTLQQYKEELSAIGPEGEKAFAQVAKSIAQADAPLIQTNTRLQEFLGTLKNTARWQISSSILHGFIGSLQSAYGYAQNLNKSLTDIQIVTGKSNAEMSAFAESANKAAKELNTTTLKYSDASLIFFQQGLNGKDVEERANVVIKMAHASGQAADEVSQQMTAVWNNFADGSKSLEYYADVMTKLGATTASSTTEIAEGLQKFASIGKTVGLSYEYAASALATITATTRESADTVGNALKSLFARIQGLQLGDTLEDGTTLNKYSNALKKVGVDIKDANGELKDMDKILDELGERWQDLSRDQQVALAETVAGQRQYAQFMTLMTNWDFMKENLNTANDSEGTLNQQAETWSKSWEAAKERVQQALNDVYEKLIDDNFFISLSDAITVVIERVSNLVDGFGGFYGILGTIGGIFTQMYAKEIPSIISNITQNISILTGKARESAVEMQRSIAESLKTNIDTTGTSNVEQVQNAALSQTAAMKADLLQKEKELSAEEKIRYEQIIKNVEATYKNVEAKAAEVDKINQEIQEAEKLAQAEAKKNKGEFYDRAAVQQALNDYRQLQQAQQSMINAQEQFGEQTATWAKRSDSEVKEVATSIDAYLHKLEEAGNIKLDDAVWDNLKIKIEEALAGGPVKVRELITELDKIPEDAFLGAKKSATELNTKIDETKEKLEGLGVTTSIDKLDSSYQKARTATEEYRRQLEILKEKEAEGVIHTTSYSEALGKTAGTLMSVSSAINSITRIKDVFTDEDSTFVDKVTAALGGLATAIFLVQSVGKTLTAWHETEIGMAVGAALAETNLATAEGLATAATTLFTAAVDALSTSFLANPLFLAGAAIVASIVLVTKAISDQNAEIQKHIENLEKEKEAIDQTYTKQKEEFDNNEELLQSYEDLVEQYRKTGEGKSAVISAGQALAEAYDVENANVLLLKGSYEDLTKAVYEYRDADLEALKTTASLEKEKQAEIIESSIKPDESLVNSDRTVYGFTNASLYGTENLSLEDLKKSLTIPEEWIDELDNSEVLGDIIKQYKENNNSFIFKTQEEAQDFKDKIHDLYFDQANLDLTGFEQVFINSLNDQLSNVSFANVQDTKMEDAFFDMFRFKDNTSGYQEEFQNEVQQAVDSVVQIYKEAGEEATIKISDTKGSRGDLFIQALGQSGDDYYKVYEQAKTWRDEFIKLFEDTDIDYSQSEVYKEVNAWLDENQAVFSAYEEILEKYKTLDLLTDTTQFEDSFLQTLDDGAINSVEEYADFVEYLTEKLREEGIAEEDIGTIIDTKYGKYGKYAEYALQLAAAEEVRKNASEKDVGKIDSLENYLIENGREEDLAFFGYIDFSEDKSDEEFANEITRIKEKAKAEDLEIEIRAQWQIAEDSGFKNGMSFSELLGFKEDSGIQWDTEIKSAVEDGKTAIISWSEFLAANDKERKAMLEEYAKDVYAVDIEQLGVLKQQAAESKAMAENDLKIAQEHYDKVVAMAKNIPDSSVREQMINEAATEVLKAEGEYDKALALLNTRQEKLDAANGKTAADTIAAIEELKTKTFALGEVLSEAMYNALTSEDGLNIDLTKVIHYDEQSKEYVITDAQEINRQIKEALLNTDDVSMEDVRSLITTYDEFLQYQDLLLEHFDSQTVEAFGESLKNLNTSFEIDKFASFEENITNLNEAFANTGDLSNYISKVKELIETSTDLGLTTDQARIAALNYVAGCLEMYGALEKNLSVFEDSIETITDLYQVLDILEANTDDSATVDKFKQQMLIKLGSQYEECTQELNNYRQALGDGTEEEKEAAENALKSSVRLKEVAEAYDYNYDTLKTLTESYEEYVQGLIDASTTLDENEKKMIDATEIAESLAERYIRVNEAIKDLQEGCEDYTDLLDRMNSSWEESGGAADSLNDYLIDDAETFSKLKEAVAGALDMEDSWAVSASFIAENADLIKGVIDGDVDALTELGNAFAQDFILNLDVDDSTFLDKVGMARDEAADTIANIPPGVIDLDTYPFLQALATLMEEAGYSAEQIKQAFAGMNIEVEFEDDVAEAVNAMNEEVNAAQEAANATEEAFVDAHNNISTAHAEQLAVRSQNEQNALQNDLDMNVEAANARIETYDESAKKSVEVGGVETEIEDFEASSDETREGAEFQMEPEPVTSHGSVPTFSSQFFPLVGMSVPIPSGFQTITSVYPGVKVIPDKKTETAHKETKTKGIKLKSATKTVGGISRRNINGGNKPSSTTRSSTPRRSTSSRQPTRVTPTRTSTADRQARATHERNETPRTETHDRETHDRETHEAKTHDRETHNAETHNAETHDRYDARTMQKNLADYLKNNPDKVLADLTEDLDEVYTNRKIYWNQRYEKDQKISEKDYETKESSIFKRLSDEIDRYHDINKVLENIGNKLDEINQRKSRAFGKAHIDAINEEKNALEQQLEAQNKYLNQMADRRTELQKTMEAQGWVFDEEGSVANYVDKKTQDVISYNKSAEQFVEQTNKNREEWNKASQEAADEYNRQRREITDFQNNAMQQLTDETNDQYAILDAQTNQANQLAVAAKNAREQQLANILNATNEAATAMYNAAAAGAVTEQNAGIAGIVATREEALTAAENAREEALTANEQARDAALTAAENALDANLTAVESARDAALTANESARDAALTANENSRDAALTANEQDRATQLGSSESKKNERIKAAEADKQGLMYNVEGLYDDELTAAENKYKADLAQAEADYNKAVAPHTGSYSDTNVANAHKDAISAAKDSFDAAVTKIQTTYDKAKAAAKSKYENSINKIEDQFADTKSAIENDFKNEKSAIENSFKNAKSAIEDSYDTNKNTIENDFKTKKNQIENDFKVAKNKAENDYKIKKNQVENDFKNQQKVIDKEFDVTIKNAERDLEAAKQKAKEEYEAGMQQSEHEYNVEMQRIEQEREARLRDIDANYDMREHEIDNQVEDMKEATDEWYEQAQEDIDKQLDQKEKLNDIAKEQAEFAYEENQKNLEEYEELESSMAQAMSDAQDLRNKIYDNALEVIDYTLNLKVELSNNVIQALTALLDSLGDSADKAADRIATLGKQMYQYTLQTQWHQKAISDLINSQGELDNNIMSRFMNGTFTYDDLQKLFNTDEFTADKVVKLESYRDGLISLISEQRALKEQMLDTVTTAFSEYQDKLGKQSEKLAGLTKITQTYQSIVGIVGKKVLDASGILSETLAKAAFDTQRDQTHIYKSVLDEIDSNLADMKQKQAAFDTDSEMFKDFQKRIDEMESERQSAQDNWLSSWEAEMQAATDYYANAIDTIAMHFEQSISGLIGSLELLSKEYDRQREIQDVYVDDYEKIYQLSKLNRDVQNAIDDSDHIKNKQQLKKLQEQINAANADGVKMSQYDLDVLRKKFELEKARAELEESRDAKSQVRMMRDAEGNYGYVYTADANAVAQAEQSYEDKLHELQVLNSNYIEQLEDNYLQLQQNVRDEIASLDITQFATEEEYLAEVDRIQQHAIEMQERLSQQMGNALGNNRDLYENEWTTYSQMTGYKISADEDYIDKFNETTYSVLTGFAAMNEAKEQFTSSLAEAIAGAIEAYRTTADMQSVAMEDGGTSMEDFSIDAINATEAVVEETQKLANEAEELSQTYQDAFGQIADSAGIFAANYVEQIQPAIDANLQLLNTINQIIEHQANLGGTSGDGSGSGGIASGVKSSNATWSAFATAGEQIGAKSKIGDYLPYVAALLQYGGYETNYGGWGTLEERRRRLVEVFGEGADEDVDKYLAEHAAADLGSYWLAIANNPEAYGYDKLKKMSFDTGGYTGNWNSLDGKLALIHEKELILNKQDTDNILSAVDMVRKITQMIDLNAISAGSFMNDVLTAASINAANNEVLQQEVHITAEFPNATDRDEIIQAFDNLTNLAMQYAGKQNNF